ncbi:hypothetical protein B0T16DRAFT_336552, partial [Cercophora newfieldiana]
MESAVINTFVLCHAACVAARADVDGGGSENATSDSSSKFDELSNNLATDVAPFLALFGEQVTKQYLSESTSFWDYLILALAPLGIITTVVSVIRVCGPKWLRSFVGRSQE